MPLALICVCMMCVLAHGTDLYLYDGVCVAMALMSVCKMRVKAHGTHVGLPDGVCWRMALMCVCKMYMPANGTHVGLPDGACRPMALMLLCEFILNSTRAPPGEEFLYHTLLELHLMGDGEEDQSTQLTSSPDADSAALGSFESSQQDAQASTSQVAYKWTAEDAVTGCNRMVLQG